MESVMYKIETVIKKQKEGTFIFADDFRGTGTSTAINVTLSRLAKNNLINRVTRGIYYKPKHHYLFGELLPVAEELAINIARRENIKIRPSGIYALHKLGLTTQVPTRIVYNTNGQSKKIVFGKTQIVFKPTTSKKMSYKGPISSLVIQALEELGTSDLNDEIAVELRNYLLKEKTDLLMHDLGLAPAYIYDYIFKLIK